MGLCGAWYVVYFVDRWRILARNLLRILSFLPLDKFAVGGVWCSLCLGVLRGGDRGMLVTLYVCLQLLSGNLLSRIGQVGGELGLRYRPSPGFHQKVGIGSPQVCASFLVRAAVRSRTPLVPASTVLVYG